MKLLAFTLPVFETLLNTTCILTEFEVWKTSKRLKYLPSDKTGIIVVVIESTEEPVKTVTTIDMVPDTAINVSIFAVKK